MPFRQEVHASQDVPNPVGLALPNCNPPRRGDCHSQGLQGAKHISLCLFMAPLQEPHARMIYHALPAAFRALTNPDQAMVVEALAHQAALPIPDACNWFLGMNGYQPPSLDYAWVAGSHIDTNLQQRAHYTTFLDTLDWSFALDYGAWQS